MRAARAALWALCAVGVYVGPAQASEVAQDATPGPEAADPVEACYDLSRPGCVCIGEAQAERLIVERRVAAEAPPPAQLEPIPAAPRWMVASVGAGFVLGAVLVFSFVR